MIPERIVIRASPDRVSCSEEERRRHPA